MIPLPLASAGPSSDAMGAVLAVVVLVTLAYAVAHLFFDQLRARYLFTTGAEYIVVGLLLGPAVVPAIGEAMGWHWEGVMTPELLRQLNPVMSLAIGWLGLTYGMQADLRALLTRRDGAMNLAMGEAMLTVVATGSATWLLIHGGMLGAYPAREVQAASWVLGASAAVGSTAAIDLVRKQFSASGQLTGLLDRAARLGELFAIGIFGLVFAASHEVTLVDMPLVGRELTLDLLDWVLISVGIGAGLGFLFYLFLDEEHERDKQFLALLGIIVFASGAAYFLQLSPLFVNLFLGGVLVNLAPNADEIRDTLQRYYRPMVLILLIFAGAMWAPVPLLSLALVAAYVGVRVLAKLIGGWVGSRGADEPVRADVGWGLLGHGEVAVAMALSYRLVFDGPLANLVFTAILASVVLTDLWSARLVKSLLVDGGEIRAERPIISEET